MSRYGKVAQLGEQPTQGFRGISRKLACADFWGGVDKKLPYGRNALMNGPHGLVGVGAQLVKQGWIGARIINIAFRPNWQVRHQEQQVT